MDNSMKQQSLTADKMFQTELKLFLEISNVHCVYYGYDHAMAMKSAGASVTTIINTVCQCTPKTLLANIGAQKRGLVVPRVKNSHSTRAEKWKVWAQ